MTTINNVSDLLNAAAEALRTNDSDMLDDLRHQVEDWAQMRDERDAQQNLLDAIEEAFCTLDA
ncbi:hypothetical protein [Rhodanobacter lindaniclasticus]